MSDTTEFKPVMPLETMMTDLHAPHATSEPCNRLLRLPGDRLTPCVLPKYHPGGCEPALPGSTVPDATGYSGGEHD